MLRFRNHLEQAYSIYRTPSGQRYRALPHFHAKIRYARRTYRAPRGVSSAPAQPRAHRLSLLYRTSLDVTMSRRRTNTANDAARLPFFTATHTTAGYRSPANCSELTERVEVPLEKLFHRPFMRHHFLCQHSCPRASNARGSSTRRR